MASAWSGKMETNVEIKASPQQFHDMFWNRPHHVSNACSDKVQACDLHQGSDFGTVGSIICWKYFHDGEYKTAKELVEAVDTEKNMITFRLLEGDLMKEYKSFVITVQCFAKSDDDKGSIIRWSFEYEKLHDAIAHPESLIRFFEDMSKDIDDHLIKGN